MAFRNIALLGAVLIVGGCSLARESLLPTLTGEEPSAKPSQASASQPSSASAAAAPGSAQNPPPSPSAANSEPPAGAADKPSGAVGAKIDEMNAALVKLEGSVSAHDSALRSLRTGTEIDVREYRQLAAQMDTELRAGAAPGDPGLLSRWTRAHNALENIGGNIASMSTLRTGLSEDFSLAIDLLQSARAAYGLPGAAEASDRQIAGIENRVDSSAATIDRLLDELTADSSRQSIYLARERGNLATLSVAIKNGGPSGASLANRAYSTTAAPGRPTVPGVATGIGGRRPLVVIRFIRPNVEYEQALYSAVSQALARKPNADFDLVAVAPGKAAKDPLAADQSKRNADAVMRSLTDMGLPADRVTLSATTSDAADTNEVRLYVR